MVKEACAITTRRAQSVRVEVGGLGFKGLAGLAAVHGKPISGAKPKV